MSEAGSLTPRFANLDAVLALIVGVGAVLYPIGFIQLVARVDLGATNDFSTAWLVASLMSPVQVAGQGVRALAGMWWFVILIAVFMLYLYRWPLKETKSFREYWDTYLFAGWRLPIVAAITLVPAAAIGLVQHSWQSVVSNLILAIMAQLIGALTVTHRARSALMEVALLTAIVYVATSASVILDASQHHDPGLPHVQVGSYNGRLVAHSDGYWYVLTSTGQLVAVPNDPTTVVIQP
jgi:hypothetical protein